VIESPDRIEPARPEGAPEAIADAAAAEILFPDLFLLT
jgi:hypothetical protein